MRQQGFQSLTENYGDFDGYHNLTFLQRMPCVNLFCSNSTIKIFKVQEHRTPQTLHPNLVHN